MFKIQVSSLKVKVERKKIKPWADLKCRKPLCRRLLEYKWDYSN